MNSASFVKDLASISLANVFNPYSDTCEVYDRPSASTSRRRNLRTYLAAVEALGVDTIWMGRDLGYRGGRRTGLALTDEFHLPELAKIYPGCESTQATLGPAVAERTAVEIWAVLRQLVCPPLLWNVFPFHPYEQGNQFTNRKFCSRELAVVDDLNAMLIKGLGIRRIIGIGQDAAAYAARFDVEVVAIRHPSYGGTLLFRDGMRHTYSLSSAVQVSSGALHPALF